MLEAIFGAVWFLSPQFVKTLLSSIAYYICSELDSFTAGRTTSTMIAAGKAVAAVQTLNIERTLDESSPPLPIYSTLTSFTKDGWKEVLAIAESHEDLIDAELVKPCWSHLRKSSC
jgi:hypothetical protein